jgi:hypothetical protein
MEYVRVTINRNHEHIYAVQDAKVLCGFCRRDPWWAPCRYDMLAPGALIEPTHAKRLTPKAPKFIRSELFASAGTISRALQLAIEDVTTDHPHA